jgi:acetyl-CoA acyltransferase
VVVVSEAVAERLSRRQVRVRACVLTSGAPGSGEPPMTRAARLAYEQAGLGPEDVSLVEVHDAAAPAELFAIEDIGLCREGEAVALLRAGETSIGGRLPVNPSGGLLSRGHPIGATGCGQVVELADQLRGRCGPRQVEGARIAMAQNGGGVLGGDEAAVVVTILERVS